MAKVGPAAKTEGALIPAPMMNDQLPAHLQRKEGGGGSLSMVRQHITPPRLKVVQRQSLPPLIDKFSAGDVVAMPSMTLISEIKKDDKHKPTTEGNPFGLVVLFFYPEFILWNPMEAKGTLSPIRARSIDSRSEIAIRSMSKETWSMTCPEMPTKDSKPLFCRFVAHMNFVVKLLLPENPIAQQPMTMSFAKGEYRAGQAFAGLIGMRNASEIYACRFEARVGPRQRGDNAWLGLDCANPSEELGIDPWVSDVKEFDEYAVLHSMLKENYEKGLLLADYDDDGGVDVPPAPKPEY